MLRSIDPRVRCSLILLFFFLEINAPHLDCFSSHMFFFQADENAAALAASQAEVARMRDQVLMQQNGIRIRDQKLQEHYVEVWHPRDVLTSQIVARNEHTC